MAAGKIFKFRGGALCLDLVNTVNQRKAGHFDDRLESYADLLSWAEQTGALDKASVRALERAAALRPADARAVLAEARELREAVYSIFNALAAGRRSPPAALATLNRMLAHALAHLELLPGPHQFDWRFAGAADALDRMLWPVARSAADLLTREQHALVRTCAADDCAWMFVDATRNRSRRWCDMGDCGNRAKARRFYRRKKESAE